MNGDKEAVDALLTDDRVQAIGFVGSTDIAQYIYAQAAANGKRAQCFGAAKNHLIVIPDADLDEAVNGLLDAGYGSAGERYMAISVAVPVGAATADALAAKLAEKVKSLRVGHSFDEAADYGPLVTREAKERVEGYFEQGIEEGASILPPALSLAPSGQPARRSPTCKNVKRSTRHSPHPNWWCSRSPT